MMETSDGWAGLCTQGLQPVGGEVSFHGDPLLRAGEPLEGEHKIQSSVSVSTDTDRVSILGMCYGLKKSQSGPSDDSKGSSTSFSCRGLKVHPQQLIASPEHGQICPPQTPQESM